MRALYHGKTRVLVAMSIAFALEQMTVVASAIASFRLFSPNADTCTVTSTGRQFVVIPYWCVPVNLPSTVMNPKIFAG